MLELRDTLQMHQSHNSGTASQRRLRCTLCHLYEEGSIGSLDRRSTSVRGLSRNAQGSPLPRMLPTPPGWALVT